MDQFEMMKYEEVAALCERIEKAKERVQEVTRAYPKVSKFISDNWDKFATMHYAGLPGLEGIRGYNFHTFGPQALEDFCHFISHEIYDDGSPGIIWIRPKNRAKGPQDFKSPAEYLDWRRSVPFLWEIVLPGDTAAMPFLVSCFWEWAHERDMPYEPQHFAICGEVLREPGAWETDVVDEELVRAVEAVGRDGESKTQKLLRYLVGQELAHLAEQDGSME